MPDHTTRGQGTHCLPCTLLQFTLCGKTSETHAKISQTYFSAAWSRTGRKGPYAHYYIQVQPNGGSFVGTCVFPACLRGNAVVASCCGTFSQRTTRYRGCYSSSFASMCVKYACIPKTSLHVTKKWSRVYGPLLAVDAARKSGECCCHWSSLLHPVCVFASYHTSSMMSLFTVVQPDKRLSFLVDDCARAPVHRSGPFRFRLRIAWYRVSHACSLYAGAQGVRVDDLCFIQQRTSLFFP